MGSCDSVDANGIVSVTPETSLIVDVSEDVCVDMSFSVTAVADGIDVVPSDSKEDVESGRSVDGVPVLNVVNGADVASVSVD